VVHVFALMLYLGQERKLVSEDMHFWRVEDCNYYARELVRRYGEYYPKDIATSYCVPKLVDPEKVRIY